MEITETVLARLRPYLKEGVPGGTEAGGEQESRAVRAFLWREKGLSGTKEAIALRETACALIRYRQVPCSLQEQEDPERTLRFIAAAGEKAPDFSWRLLCGLAEADAQEAGNAGERIRKIRAASEAAGQAGCLDGPYPFPDPRTMRAYFAGLPTARGNRIRTTPGGKSS